MHDKPLLVMFLGVPGSGKTTFAKQLREKLSAVVLNSDSIRLSMWGSQEAIWETHVNLEARALNNQLTFGAMDYAAGQVINAGYNVIYDCNANKYQERHKMATIAADNGGEAVVVYIKTPHEMAIRRITERQASHDSLQKNPEKAREIVERFAAAIEAPYETEFVIEISGEVPFEEQYQVFKQALDQIS